MFGSLDHNCNVNQDIWYSFHSTSKLVMDYCWKNWTKVFTTSSVKGPRGFAVTMMLRGIDRRRQALKRREGWMGPGIESDRVTKGRGDLGLHHPSAVAHDGFGSEMRNHELPDCWNSICLQCYLFCVWLLEIMLPCIRCQPLIISQPQWQCISYFWDT